MRALLLSWQVGALLRFLPPEHGNEQRPTRLAYLADAARSSGELPEWAVGERQRLVDLGYELTDITAIGAGATQLAAQLDHVDGLYVAGGETFFLLRVLKESGLFDVIHDRVVDGLPYIGVSAGSVIAGKSIEPISLMDDPSLAAPVTDLSGFGFLNAAVVPHADGQMSQFPSGLIIETVAEYHDAFELVLIGDTEAMLLQNDEVTPLASPVAKREAAPPLATPHLPQRTPVEQESQEERVLPEREPTSSPRTAPAAERRTQSVQRGTSRATNIGIIVAGVLTLATTLALVVSLLLR